MGSPLCQLRIHSCPLAPRVSGWCFWVRCDVRSLACEDWLIKVADLVRVLPDRYELRLVGPPRIRTMDTRAAPHHPICDEHLQTRGPTRAPSASTSPRGPARHPTDPPSGKAFGGRARYQRGPTRTRPRACGPATPRNTTRAQGVPYVGRTRPSLGLNQDGSHLLPHPPSRLTENGFVRAYVPYVRTYARTPVCVHVRTNVRTYVRTLVRTYARGAVRECRCVRVCVGSVCVSPRKF